MRLVLVLGQAAQGKSTLAAEYVGTLSEPFVWINLDGDDSDPTNLFLWLVRAMQSAWPDLDFSRVISIPSSTMGPRAPGPMFREWVSAVWELIPQPMEFVLDGLDRLGAESPAFELLRVFIEETPPDFRWLLLSRSRPPLEIERWEMNRIAHTIANQDLAFTASEIKALGQTLYKYEFAPDQVRTMLDYTEGWAGGLIILLENLQQYSAPQNGFDVLSRELGRFKGRIFQYLAEQVFDRLPAQTQDFLTITSILDTIDPQSAEQLTGTKGLEAILQNLVDRNFFVTGHYDPDRGWRYRYHQLFKEFLQAKFEAGNTPEQRSGWASQAAQLSVARNEPEAALRLYLKAGDWGRAADLLSGLGIHLLRAGRFGDLFRWISALPGETVLSDPWLSIYLCATRRYTAAGKNLPILTRAAVQLRETGDRQGRLIALAFLIEARTNTGLYVPETIEESLALLKEPPIDDYPFERGSLWHQIGFAETLHGDYHLAYNACRNATVIARQLKNNTLLVNALANSVTIIAFLGKFNELEEVRREMERLLAGTENQEMHCFYLVALSLATVFRGDPEGAIPIIKRSIRDIEAYGLYYLTLPAQLYQVICLGYSEKMEEVNRAAEETISFSQTIQNLFLETVTRLFLGIGLYRCGHFEKAETMLQKAVNGFRSRQIQAPYHENAGVQVLNLTRMGRGFFPKIEEMKLAYRRFLESGSPLLTADSCLALSLGFQATGHYEEAIKHLSQGLTLSAQYGYDFFIFLSRKDTARVCALAVAHDLTDVIEEASRLLCGRFAPDAPDYLRPLLKHRNAPVRDRARDLLIRIRRQNLPLVQIKTLGGFVVRRNHTELTEQDWAGAMSKMLLKAVIALGPRRVSKDIVMGALWPDASSKAAESNFKIALHRLRRALEPDMDPTLGSAYITLKENTLTLTDGVAEIDMESFENSVSRARRAAGGKPKLAIAAFDAALEAYTGAFLEEDLYADWAVNRRDHLRNQCIELLQVKAGRHDDLGHFRKAAACYHRVLEMDAIHEEAARRLMNLYSAYGRQNEAIKVFHKLSRSLMDQIGIEPEKLTKAIYEKIREQSS